MLPTLSPEVSQAVTALTKAESRLAGIAQRDAFVMGFRLGVQMMVESLYPCTAPSCR